MRITSRGEKTYVFVIVDDYSCFTWTLFLTSKDESFEKFLILLKKIKKRVGHSLVSIRSDHGKEFENFSFIEYWNKYGVDHNFFAPRTPQQNGVVEHKNRTLKDITGTMLIASGLPRNFWAEALNTPRTGPYLTRLLMNFSRNKNPILCT